MRIFTRNGVLILVMLWTIGCVDRSVVPREKEKEVSVCEIAQILNTCPSWSDFDGENVEVTTRIIDCLERLSPYDLDSLREAVEQYLTRTKDSNGRSPMKVACRLYVLNRFLFNVPNTFPEDCWTYSGWVGVPRQDGQVDLMWPLSFDREYNIRLTGRFRGYSGSPYQR